MTRSPETGRAAGGSREHRPATPRRRGRRRGSAGFSLLELLLALVLGIGLSGLLLHVLVAQGRQGALIVRQLRERSWQRRTLDLVRLDLQRADWVRLGSARQSACSLSGRAAVLEIGLGPAVVTYSIGAPPSAIWRGRVLMRCGPAFGLDGEPSSGAAQNRVVLDALPEQGLRAEALDGGRLRLRLSQEFPLSGAGSQRVTSAAELAALVLPP